MTNKQIAAALHISRFTVSNHVHSILEKLQVPDRYSAVAKGLNISVDVRSKCDLCPIAGKAMVIAQQLVDIAEDLLQPPAHEDS